MSLTSIQVRALLAEKFPGLKTRLPDPAPVADNLWPVALAGLDPAWPDGLAKGALTEIIAGSNSGSAGLMHALLYCAAKENQIVALIDGADSLEVGQLGEKILSRLLWVRCCSTAEVTKAADLVLRDQNFSLVLIDLKMNPVAQLRKIPATVWHRWQRLIENTATVCVVCTPHTLVSATRRRVILRAKANPSLAAG
jgi:hypothetical protein